MKKIIAAAITALALTGCVVNESWVHATDYRLKATENCPTRLDLELRNEGSKTLKVTWPSGYVENVLPGKTVHDQVHTAKKVVTVKVEGFEPDVFYPQYCTRIYPGITTVKPTLDPEPTR
jgi:hypothetical protein